MSVASPHRLSVDGGVRLHQLRGAVRGPVVGDDYTNTQPVGMLCVADAVEKQTQTVSAVVRGDDDVQAGRMWILHRFSRPAAVASTRRLSEEEQSCPHVE